MGAEKMRTYQNKQELIQAIQTQYQKYIAEFANIPETQKDLAVEGVDKTPSQNLAYQLGWLNLMLEWDRKEKQGLDVQTPTPDYKWNQLGGLYQSFYNKYGNTALQTQVDELNALVDQFIAWIDSLNEAELFEVGQRKWATTKARWPLWRWIDINTVSPFTTFRTKIRKWKKLAL